MNKTKFSFLTIGICTAMAFVTLGVFAGSNKLVRSYGSMTYKHFDAVAPTVVDNGSKEYWTDCAGGAPLFEEPEGATIVDAGAPSAEWVAALDPSDSRYVRPTREESDVVRTDANFYPSVAHGTSDPFNYYFFDTAASTAVISVQVPAALINGGGSTTVGGIVATGGLTLGAAATGGGDRDANDYNTFNFGIHTQGIKTYSDNGWYRGRAPGDDWILPNLYYDKTTKESIGGKARELTVVLENNKFGLYIDGKFILEIPSNASDYFNNGITNSTYRLGVFFGAAAVGTTMTLNRELYGDDADSYIRQTIKYKMSKSGNVYTHQNVPASPAAQNKHPGYWYVDGQYSTAIVAELSFDAIYVQTDSVGQFFAGLGFILTDGVTAPGTDVSAVTKIPATDPKNLIITPQLYGVNIGSNFINVRNPDAWGNRGGDKFAALLYNKNNKDQTIKTQYDDATVTLSTITLTAIYNGGKLHAYVNGAYICGFNINESNVTYLGHGNAIAPGTPLKLGVYSIGYQQGSASATLTKYMVGSAATTEIAANYTEAA